jgi:hypothetical protein
MDQMRWRSASAKLASMMMIGLLAACGGGEEADEVPAEESAAAPAAPAMPEATVVEPMQLQTGAAALAGQTVRVNAMKVVSRLGPKGFWVELPNRNPFLVVTTEDATANPNDVVDVVGTVTQMNDSILTNWVSSGAITENQRLEAEFATEFLQAQAVAPSTGAPATP